jgi:phosphoserine phosphatase
MSARPVAALMYDFDGTLSPGSMQEHSFIPALGVPIGEFWKEVNGEAADLGADNILIYMHRMVEAARVNSLGFRRDDIIAYGEGISFFPGVEDWFDRVTAHGDAIGLEVEHYIISSGLEDMIRGSRIGEKFKAIFASRFKYDHHDVPVWASLAVNYTNKTQFIFRINKGALDLSDHKRVNEFAPHAERPVPFENMIYVGDGDTDIPCMRTVKEMGGRSIGVFRPDSEVEQEKITKMSGEGRINFGCAADYSDGSKLDAYVKAALEKIAAQEKLQALEK